MLIRCLQSDCDSVKFVSNYAVFHGSIKSGLGHNYLIACTEHISLSVPFVIHDGFLFLTHDAFISRHATAMMIVRLSVHVGQASYIVITRCILAQI